jgi:hypothetical protein
MFLDVQKEYYSLLGEKFDNLHFINKGPAYYGDSKYLTRQEFEQAVELLHSNLQNIRMNFHFYSNRRSAAKSVFNLFLTNTKGRFVSLFRKREDHVFEIEEGQFSINCFYYDYLVSKGSTSLNMKAYYLFMLYCHLYELEHSQCMDRNKVNRRSVLFALRMVKRYMDRYHGKNRKTK